MFAVFVACAIVPVVTLTAVSYRNTRANVRENSTDRLQQATKAFGMSLLERLLFARSELEMLSRQVEAGAELVPLQRDAARFDGVALWRDGAVVERFGDPFVPQRFTEAQLGRLADGNAIATFESTDTSPAPVAVVTMAAADGTLLSGTVNPEYGWGRSLQLGMPLGAEMVILTADQQTLASTLSAAETDHLLAQVRAAAGGTRKFEVTADETTFFGGRWGLPLEYEFGHPGLLLVTFEDSDVAMAAVSGFGRTYAFLGLTVLWIVTLLSISQIRRYLVPLEKLKEATHRVAEHDFKHSVTVTSGDEFQDLAESFNGMTRRIDSQFDHLATLASIERGILSSLQIEPIVDTTISMVEDTYPRSRVAVSLLGGADSTIRTYERARGDKPRRSLGGEQLMAPASDAETGYRRYGIRDSWPAHVEFLQRSGSNWCLEFPFAIGERPAGALFVAFVCSLPDTDDRAQLRQISSQLAVALANARLVDELDDMKLGALTALARTVDAKSTWTRGHSERVTSLAVRLGTELGLAPIDIERLNRGGLLHDIGKIGIPNVILDKPGRLSADEYELVKTHPSLGARILEPIRAYADVLPIVEQHHERVDGKGYPNGLTGEQMDPLARITAVADVFDACRSDRPYRAGMSLDKVTGIILAGKGSHFEPLAVEAFESVIASEVRFFESLKAA